MEAERSPSPVRSARRRNGTRASAGGDGKVRSVGCAVQRRPNVVRPTSARCTPFGSPLPRARTLTTSSNTDVPRSTRPSPRREPGRSSGSRAQARWKCARSWSSASARRTRVASGARTSISRASRPVTSRTTPRRTCQMRRRWTDPSGSSSARSREGRRPSHHRNGGSSASSCDRTVARRSKRLRARSTISARSTAMGHRASERWRTATLRVDFAGRARPYSPVQTMRPTEQQHREALAGHADRLARFMRGQIPSDSWRPIRLSYGLYYQLDHTSHMQRIKIPGGLLTAAQLDVMAEVADLYGRGIAHVTTRQDIQIHWVPLEGIIDLYERLLAVDISTRGACSDSVRNVTACPFAGVHPEEPFDVGPYCMAIHDYFLFNPLNLTLPRKFKIAVEGCPEDCAQVPVNDIGLYAKVQDGVRGFAVWAGGGLGAQPFLAKHIADFVPAEDILVWCEAIVRVQHRHGERKNRSRARMKYVVKRLGHEGFRSLIEAEVGRVDAERGEELRAEVREWVATHRVPAPPTSPKAAAPASEGFDHWHRTNVRPQRQEGYATALVQLPLGDITSDQMRAVARLVAVHGNGTLRTTNDQNLVLPWIPRAALPAVHSALLAAVLGNPDVGTVRSEEHTSELQSL